MYLGEPDDFYLGLTDSSMWASGAGVADVPPPPAPNFPFACLYSDGSRELAASPGDCPVKTDADLLEVDDLTQVSSGSGIPPTEPPAIIVNVPSTSTDGTLDVPPVATGNIPTPSLPSIYFPPTPPPVAAPGQAPPAEGYITCADGTTVNDASLCTSTMQAGFPWWLGAGLVLLLLGSSSERGRRRVSR